MKRMLLCFLVTGISLAVHAQLLTWTPPFPKEDDATQTLTITMDASKGNQGLLNFTSDVYVHIGVITNLSGTGWVHVPFTWATTPAAAKTVSLGNNRWQYTINGSLRSFFGVTDPSEHILKIGLLFRSGDGSRSQRNRDGSDMFIPVYDASLAVRIDVPAREPLFNPQPESMNVTTGAAFPFTANASQPSSITLYHNGQVVATGNNIQTLTANPVATTGQQQLVAVANNGTTSRSDTLNFFITGTSPLPAGVRDGINYEAGDNSVVLVLRAPNKSQVAVIGDFNNWQPTASSQMSKTPDGKFWWVRISGLTPGQEYAYQYLVNGSLRIADPYAEKILDPTPGDNNQTQDQNISTTTYPNLKPYPAGQTGIVSVLQTKAPAYNWSVPNFTRPDQRGLVIYELLVRDFVAAHDWKTVRDSLNYLKTLGINAIEIMPFNEFEGNKSWGYNPDFYFAPDKYYGTANALREFIDSCHKKGIAVIMDIALNHSFGESPMVKLYWDAANNRPSVESPWFNPVAKHAFNVGYDMNHSTADTKYFVSRVTEHWLTKYKIDGFRFDLSKGFTQTQTCDGNGNNCDVAAWGAPDASRIALWKGYYDTLQLKSPGSYAILEHFADDAEEQVLADYGMMFWGNLNYNFGQAAMGYTTDWDFSRAIASSHGFSKQHLVTYMESHDEERIVYKNKTFGNSATGYNTRDAATSLKRSELAAAFLFAIPGPKMLWQFGELGYDYSINACSNGTISNDCRLDNKPIRWDYLQDPLRKNLYTTYSKMINLRFQPVLKNAFLTGTVDRNLQGAVKWLRVNSGDTAQIFVAGNFGLTAQAATLTFPASGTWFDYLNNTTFSATGTAQNMSFEPGEYHVWVNRNVNNLAVTPVINVPWNGETLEAALLRNPASSVYAVQLQLPRSSQVRLSVYTTTGQFAGLAYDRFLSAGEHKLELSAATITAGTYYIVVTTKQATKTLKLIIQ